MSKQWREVIWPTKSLAKYFCPSDLKLKFPKTRVLVDGTVSYQETETAKIPASYILNIQKIRGR
jgi:hypothetical protein